MIDVKEQIWKAKARTMINHLEILEPLLIDVEEECSECKLTACARNCPLLPISMKLECVRAFVRPIKMVDVSQIVNVKIVNAMMEASEKTSRWKHTLKYWREETSWQTKVKDVNDAIQHAEKQNVPIETCNIKVTPKKTYVLVRVYERFNPPTVFREFKIPRKKEAS